MEEVIPQRLMRSEQVVPFMAWLRDLHVDPEDKKQILFYWCDSVGLRTTADMVKRAGIERR